MAPNLVLTLRRQHWAWCPPPAINGCFRAQTRSPAAREWISFSGSPFEEEEVVIVISLGLPTKIRSPENRTFEQWIEAADRLPMADLVERR